jgi:hypothetical protein
VSWWLRGVRCKWLNVCLFVYVCLCLCLLLHSICHMSQHPKHTHHAYATRAHSHTYIHTHGQSDGLRADLYTTALDYIRIVGEFVFIILYSLAPPTPHPPSESHIHIPASPSLCVKLGVTAGIALMHWLKACAISSMLNPSPLTPTPPLCHRSLPPPTYLLIAPPPCMVVTLWGWEQSHW